MEIDVDADRVAIWWDPTIDPSDELEWEDGERIEREGNTYTVHIDDALVLVDSEERSTRYETEETVRYHNNEWTVVAIEVETARLSGGDGVRSIKTGGSSGDVIKVAGEEYEIRLDVEGSVELCQVE